MFRHDESDDSSDESESEENESENDEDAECDKTFINPSLIETSNKENEDKKSELIKFTIYLPCKDTFLSNDKNFYTEELNKMEEIDNVEDLWINGERGMKVGTYLQTNLKFYTKYATKWKNDTVFRQGIWDRLKIRETEP